jgi:redox-sensitive bicupin YhaK (pirin superfamily)
MPKGDAMGRMHGFQLWGNLPKALKMTAPRYQDIAGTELPERSEDDGTSIRVVIGDYRGVKSPVEGIAADPQYLDIFVAPGKRKTFKVETRRRAFAYVFDGAGSFRDAARPEGVLLEKEVAGQEVNIRDLSGNRTLVRFGAGDEVTVTAGPDGVRFLLISGAPIEEPVAWAGPIVMNTEAELQQAFRELRNGTFIRPGH